MIIIGRWLVCNCFILFHILDIERKFERYANGDLRMMPTIYLRLSGRRPLPGGSCTILEASSLIFFSKSTLVDIFQYGFILHVLSSDLDESESVWLYEPKKLGNYAATNHGSLLAFNKIHKLFDFS